MAGKPKENERGGTQSSASSERVVAVLPARAVRSPLFRQLWLQEKKLLAQRRSGLYRRAKLEVDLANVRRKMIEAGVLPAVVPMANAVAFQTGNLVPVVKKRRYYVSSVVFGNAGDAMQVDPTLTQALKFSDRLRSGQARVLTPEESQAAWQESDRQIAELERLAAETLAGSNAQRG